MKLKEILTEKWSKPTKVAPSEKGKHSNKSVKELRSQLAKAKKAGNTDLVRELDFAIRAKTGWGKVQEGLDRGDLSVLDEALLNDIYSIVAEKAPSAGMTKKQKSAVVKRAKKGSDIGKKGKHFKEVASKAAKRYGSKEAGERVAAAVMWKQQAK